ncbi:hypothetical protein DPMN_013300 [Dreissena polymorpha]|uniref:Uncharacterized protein n=1 Tax=Dreissena polymorpha TaxID=45954 RepID=A0A9D4N422_DREPO|nr:hypothetical protein DPMN_013300 [Dreissena polymorpha]
MLDQFSEQCEKRIVSEVRTGVDGKLNGDNLDIYVKTNDIRMKNKNRDYHFFASDWTPYRITDEDFVTNEWLKTYVESQRCEEKAITPEMLNPDLITFQSSVKTLVSRELLKIFPEFKWMKLVVPDHIPHHLEEIMSRQTKSFTLPILLKNEAKYEDCVCIMDSYNQQMSDWYRKAGRSKCLTSHKVSFCNIGSYYIYGNILASVLWCIKYMLFSSTYE